MARRETRTQERQRQLSEAASVRLPKDCDVIVVGGGASGLVAAIAASEAGASVVVFESEAECGRRILATGNGRCNFANERLDPTRYNDPAFVGAVCGPTWLEDVLSFFHDSGMRWCSEEGRLYPLSLQAASVRNVLLARARAAGVVLAPARSVVHVSHPKDGPHPVEVSFSALFEDDETPSTCRSRALVMAAGGKTALSLEGLGIRTSPRVPVLCPLACDESPLRVLDGRKVVARVRLFKDGQSECCWSDRGGVLFRDYGISGIVVFDLSRRTEKGDIVELDLVPDLPEAEILQIVDPSQSGSFVPGALDGVIDPTIAEVIERLARERWQLPQARRTMPKTDTEALVLLAKALPLRVVGQADVRQSQVTRGGITTDQLDPKTLSLRDHPWLFASGEALDVDADCGGFNLAWAWKSGMVAGAAAARSALS